MSELCINGENIPYEIIRSSRKTIGLEISQEAQVIVRAPARMSLRDIEAFVQERRGWIEKNRARQLERKRASASIDWKVKKQDTYAWAMSDGGELLLMKVRYYADLMGVHVKRVTIRDMKTRWGSCTSKGHISFSWKIFVMPERLADYLIIHELSHLRHMDHSSAFWAHVGMYCPEYKKIKKEFERFM